MLAILFINASLYNKMTNLRGRRGEQQQLPTQTITLNLIIGKSFCSGQERDGEEEERWRQIIKYGMTPKTKNYTNMGGGEINIHPEMYPHTSNSQEKNWDPEKVERYSLSSSWCFQYSAANVDFPNSLATKSARYVCNYLHICMCNTVSENEQICTLV